MGCRLVITIRAALALRPRLNDIPSLQLSVIVRVLLFLHTETGSVPTLNIQWA